MNGFSRADWRRFDNMADTEKYVRERRAELAKSAPKRAEPKAAPAKPTRQTARKKLDFAVKKKFYAVYSGESQGVFDSLLEAARAVNEGGGEYEVFDTEDEAW